MRNKRLDVLRGIAVLLVLFYTEHRDTAEKCRLGRGSPIFRLEGFSDFQSALHRAHQTRYD